MLRKKFSLNLVAGNVGTKEGTRLIRPVWMPSKWGSAGVHLYDPCRRWCRRTAGDRDHGGAGVATNRIPVIADGGVKQTGDIKAIAAGADSVIGGLRRRGESP
jgi:hypothetical protein